MFMSSETIGSGYAHQSGNRWHSKLLFSVDALMDSWTSTLRTDTNPLRDDVVFARNFPFASALQHFWPDGVPLPHVS